jgi:hypothetical protein
VPGSVLVLRIYKWKVFICVLELPVFSRDGHVNRWVEIHVDGHGNPEVMSVK